MSRFDALVDALTLALSAPSENQAARAAALAEGLARGMTPVEVDHAKQTAIVATCSHARHDKIADTEHWVCKDCGTLDPPARMF